MRIVFYLLIAYLCVAATGAQAQSRIDPAQQLLKEQERNRKLEDLKKSQAGQDIKVQPAPGAVKSAEGCFQIRQIVVEGVTALKPWDVEAVVKPRQNTCIGSPAVQGLMQELTNQYLKLGHITTRVYIPKQDLKTGVLKLLVVEGHIEGIVFRQVFEGEPKPQLGPDTKGLTAFPAGQGALFNLRELEQGLDQINRLPSSKATVDLMPGKTPGGSIIVVTEQKQKRVRATVGADNSGSQSTGVTRLKAGVEFDEPLWLNESWAFNVVGTRNSNAVTGLFSIPYGSWTLSANGSYSENQQSLTSSTALFNQTASSSLKLDNLIYRDATSKLRVSAALSTWWNNRIINASELTPQKRGAVRFGVGNELHLPGSVVSVDLGFNFGAPWWFGTPDSPLAAASAPKAEFAKFDGTVYWLHSVPNVGRLVVTASGQLSSDILLSPDQIVIGGWETIRAYQGADAAGDLGAFVRSELILGIPSIRWPANMATLGQFYETNKKSVEPYVFLDAGHVQANASGARINMMSAGAGVRMTTDRLKFDLAVGEALLPVANVDRWSWQANGSVTVNLY